MYGGFAYRWDPEARSPRLLVGSWSRVCDGSEQDHAIDEGGIVLLRDGVEDDSVFEIVKRAPLVAEPKKSSPPPRLLSKLQVFSPEFFHPGALRQVNEKLKRQSNHKKEAYDDKRSLSEQHYLFQHSYIHEAGTLQVTVKSNPFWVPSFFIVWSVR